MPCSMALLRPVLLLLVCAGCARFPELDRALSEEARAAPPPRIAPIGPLVAAVPEDEASAAREATLARAADLRDQGDALRAQAPRGAPRAEVEARRARLAAERERLAP